MTRGKKGGDAKRASLPVALTRDGRPGRPSDRDRIIAATFDVVSAIGFAQAKTTDIIATAGMGRRTFWKYFSDKSTALIAGYVEITDELRSVVQRVNDLEPDPILRVHACLAAIAGFLAEDPARAEVLLVQGPCAGREVIEIRTETMRRLGELLAAAVAEIAPCPAGSPDRSQIVIESFAGGLYEVAFTRTVAGQVRELPGLVPELAQIVLGPYLDRGADAVPSLRTSEHLGRLAVGDVSDEVGA